jgi:hypothetical protein
VRRLVILLLTAAVAFVPVIGAIAATTLEPFTQSELDTNWVPDRQAPSDGVTSVSAFGRDDVARIGVDSSQTQAGLFQRTEGIKTAGSSDFGDGVHVDLYIDPDWQDKAVRAGVWVVGDDGLGARDELFAIIEFVNNEPCPEPDCSNPANITDHEGWRIWDSVNGWTNSNAAFEYGQWFTLVIELDVEAEQYNYYVEGEEIGSGPGGQNFIREAFLNSYNYGLDDFPTLSSESYAAHWHVDDGPAPIVMAVGEATMTLCADLWTGQLSSPPNGHCGARQVEVVTPSVQPLAFCINPYSGIVQYTFGRPCNPPMRVHVVPANGDLRTCVSLYTGMNRRVFSHAQCSPYERPNVVPAG